MHLKINFHWWDEDAFWTWVPLPLTNRGAFWTWVPLSHTKWDAFWTSIKVPAVSQVFSNLQRPYALFLCPTVTSQLTSASLLCTTVIFRQSSTPLLCPKRVTPRALPATHSIFDQFVRHCEKYIRARIENWITSAAEELYSSNYWIIGLPCINTTI